MDLILLPSATAPTWTEMTSPLHRNEACNFAQAKKRVATRAAQWRRWQSEADDIWEGPSGFVAPSVARLVKRRLQVSEHTDSIARRIRK